MSDALNQSLLKKLKKNTAKHYNLSEKRTFGKISTGSLILDHKTGGGFGPGLICSYGSQETGKTAVALNCCSDFLTKPKRKALFVKAEGRLDEEVIGRYPFEFITDVSDWRDGTCLVLRTNDYDLFLEFMEQLVHNSDGYEFLIIVDSVNGLCSENEKMCGTANITSHFLQKYTIHLSELGFYVFFNNQMRSVIADKYQAKEERNNLSMAGGWALRHAANWILQFAPIDGTGNQIMKGDQRVGHNCLIKLRKTTNETTGDRVSYPVKRGVKKGNCVWLEREIFSFFLMFDLVARQGKGGSFEWSDYAKEFNAKLPMDVPAKFRSEDMFIDFLESNQEFTLAWKKELQDSFINDQEI